MRSSIVTLFIDTSSSFLYSGIVKDERLIAEVKENLEKKLSEQALVKIEEMFHLAKITPKEIDRIVVVNGPGSFTGVRIGVTIAKTYAWALKKEIIPIRSLEAMAVSTKENKLKVSFIDARRGYVFAGVYDKDNQVVLENQYIELSKLKSFLEGKEENVVWIGNDSLLEETVKEYNPDILQIVEFVKERPPINPHAVNPEYLKRTEAEETKGIEAS